MSAGSSDLSLSLPDNAISHHLSQRSEDSASSLAALIATASPDTLDSVLETLIDRFLLFCSSDRPRIDAQIAFLASVARQLPPSLTHPGEVAQPDEPVYRFTLLRACSGPGVIAERLSQKLYGLLWEHTSRAATPDVKLDRRHRKTYYATVALNATVLARAFATQEAFRPVLWREMEDVIIKGLFSGEQQEPGVFIALTALFLGAGAEIREYLASGVQGNGMGWLWWDDVRTEDKRWGWEDIAEAVWKVPDPKMDFRLPDFAKINISVAKHHLAQDEMSSLDSETLARKVFCWVDDT
ncbi:hypothetical protein BD779DRAFT_1469547 [Infundibulicybe gibba]|nr:hypothetical protein BD779DRAFT_1469547 [Infundibulicybe gibba]